VWIVGLVLMLAACTERDTDGAGSSGEEPTTASPTTTTSPDPTVGPPGDSTTSATSDPTAATVSTVDTGPLVDMCSPDGSSEPTFEVGHGSDGFAPFSDGPAELVYGDQGGIHIELGMRAQYLDVSGPFLSEVRGYIDGMNVATGQQGTFFKCRPDQTALEREGIRLIFELNPDQVHGQTVMVEAMYQDTRGVTVMASDSVLVLDPTMG